MDVHDKATRSYNMSRIKGKEHEARNAGAEVSVCPWIPVQAECEIPSRKTRYCFTQIQNRDFY